MEITLAAQKNIVVVPEQTVFSNKIQRGAVIDDEDKKIIIVFYTVDRSPTNKIVLWSGAAYDAIGNWTFAEVDARLKELL